MMGWGVTSVAGGVARTNGGRGGSDAIAGRVEERIEPTRIEGRPDKPAGLRFPQTRTTAGGGPGRARRGRTPSGKPARGRGLQRGAVPRHTLDTRLFFPRGGL